MEKDNRQLGIDVLDNVSKDVKITVIQNNAGEIVGKIVAKRNGYYWDTALFFGDFVGFNKDMGAVNFNLIKIVENGRDNLIKEYSGFVDIDTDNMLNFESDMKKAGFTFYKII